MKNDVFSDFHVRPDFFGNLPRGGDLSLRFQRLFGLCRAMLCDRSFGAVCVQGDTATAYAGALAGFLAGIPVCHLEAGLRTYETASPFPEEMMRRSIATMATLHFCTNGIAKTNLLAEGVKNEQIHVIGNTGEDAMRRFLQEKSPFPRREKRRILLTLHRRETADGDFRKLLQILAKGAKDGAYEVLFPIHPCPRMTALTSAFRQTPGFRMTCPLSPAVFYPTLKSADLVLTDSGGVTEESAVLGVPTLIFRWETERVAELSSGRASLFAMDKDFEGEILRGFSLPRSAPRFHTPSPSETCARVLLSFFDGQSSFFPLDKER